MEGRGHAECLFIPETVQGTSCVAPLFWIARTLCSTSYYPHLAGKETEIQRGHTMSQSHTTSKWHGSRYGAGIRSKDDNSSCSCLKDWPADQESGGWWGGQYLPVQGSSNPFSLLSWLLPTITYPCFRMHQRHCPSKIPALPLSPGLFPLLTWQGAINIPAFLGRCLFDLSLKTVAVCAPCHQGTGTFPIGVPGKVGARGKRRKLYVLVVEQKYFCFSFLMTCLQVPTSGTAFSQKPRLIVLEVALLYARHKHGFHGNISGGGC